MPREQCATGWPARDSYFWRDTTFGPTAIAARFALGASFLAELPIADTTPSFKAGARHARYRHALAKW